MDRDDGQQAEFGHFPEGTIPDALFDRAAKEISNFLVSFAIEDRPSGSATLVTLQGKHGFLTAAHVLDDLLNSKSSHIAIVCARQLHRLLIDKNHVESVKLGPSQEDEGPDLAFLSILDPVSLSVLKAKKSFYSFTNPVAPMWEKVKPKESLICFIAGAPAEMSRESGIRQTKDHILYSSHFVGRAQFVEEIQRGEFSYLKLGTIAGKDGFPESFGGVSGGGVWHVPFEMDPRRRVESLVYLRPELIGVAFYQSDLKGDSRQILAHAYDSAYTALIKKLTVD